MSVFLPLPGQMGFTSSAAQHTPSLPGASTRLHGGGWPADTAQTTSARLQPPSDRRLIGCRAVEILFCEWVGVGGAGDKHWRWSIRGRKGTPRTIYMKEQRVKKERIIVVCEYSADARSEGSFWFDLSDHLPSFKLALADLPQIEGRERAGGESI